MTNVAYADFRRQKVNLQMENKKQGHVALFRSLLSKEWAKDTAKLAMWIRLIGEASYKPRTVKFAGKEWHLQLGELVTTTAILARKLCDQDGTEKSKQSVIRMLNFFVREGMITTRGTKLGTVICITNYSQYQIGLDYTPADTRKSRCDNALEGAPGTPPDTPLEQFLAGTPCDTPADTNKLSAGKASACIPGTPPEARPGEQNKKLVEQEVNNKTHSQLALTANCEKLERRKPISFDYESYLNAYNDIVGDRLPHAVEVNAQRKRKLKSLVGSLATPNLDGFRAYVLAFMAAARPFHFGENDRSWVANFDYLLQRNTLTKIREGTL